MLATETYLNGGKGTTATMETLLNRSIMVGNTIWQELNSGFYGPINKGIAQRRGLNAKEQQFAQDAINNAAGGSDLTEGRTDQGSGNDPNVRGPGRVKVPGTNEVYNYWTGTRRGRSYSHADAARFAEEMERKANEARLAKQKQPPAPVASGANKPIIDDDHIRTNKPGQGPVMLPGITVTAPRTTSFLDILNQFNPIGTAVAAGSDFLTRRFPLESISDIDSGLADKYLDFYRKNKELLDPAAEDSKALARRTGTAEVKGRIDVKVQVGSNDDLNTKPAKDSPQDRNYKKDDTDQNVGVQ
jgi:hypothetical protein